MTCIVFFQTVLLKCAQDSIQAVSQALESQKGSSAKTEILRWVVGITAVVGTIWGSSASYSVLTKTLKDMIQDTGKIQAKSDEKFKRVSDRFDGVTGRFIFAQFAGYFVTVSPVVFYLAITLVNKGRN
jgi:hypothetical protein